MGMDPGFHRGDCKVGMTGIQVDLQLWNSQPLGSKLRLVLGR